MLVTLWDNNFLAEPLFLSHSRRSCVPYPRCAISVLPLPLSTVPACTQVSETVFTTRTCLTITLTLRTVEPKPEDMPSAMNNHLART